MSKRNTKNRDLEMKITKCMTAHLNDGQAEHVFKQALERGWSNSQYLRWLVILDKKRVDDEADLMSRTAGIPREQFDPSVHLKRRKGDR